MCLARRRRTGALDGARRWPWRPTSDRRVAVTTVATLLAVAAGRGPAAARCSSALAVLAGQASIGWSNDWLDADRDRAVARADKPVVQGAGRPRPCCGTAALVGGRAGRRRCRCCSGSCPGLLLLALVASGWAYNAGPQAHRGVRRCPTWSASARCRPAWSPRPRAPRSRPGGWSPPARALGGAAHLANVAPDLEDDLATGVRGLPHRLGATASGGGRRAAARRRLAGAGARPGRPADARAGWVGLAVAVPAVVVAALAGTAALPPAAFPAVMLLTVLDVVLLLVGGGRLT